MKFYSSFLFRMSWVVGFIQILMACSTLAPVKTVSREEIVKRNHILSGAMAQGLQPFLKLKHDKQTISYIQRLAQTLVDSNPDLRGFPVNISLLRSTPAQSESKRTAEKWRSFSLPENKIYLSVGILHLVEYENELSSLVAIELGHIQNNHLLSHLKMYPQLARIEDGVPILSETGVSLLKGGTGRHEYLGQGGILQFSEEEELEAAGSAVEIVYRAGYDPRGVLSIYQHYLSQLDHSPYSGELLEKLIQKVRLKIAEFVPLRNPIVRSQSFLQIQKRIHQL